MEDSENLSAVGHGSEAERYQKVRVLGEGSMGKAYLVSSAEDGQLYVMKRINIGHLEAKEREGALREAQLHRLLEHPNIVQFKELYQTTGDKLCIIMEYAEGNYKSIQAAISRSLFGIRMANCYQNPPSSTSSPRSVWASRRFMPSTPPIS